MKILNETELKEVSGGGMWDGANGYAYRDANGGWQGNQNAGTGNSRRCR